METRERILILSGDLGEGHKQAANALLEASGLCISNVEVQIVDFMELVSPRLHTVSKYLYLQGIKTFPSVYGYFYQKTRKANTLSGMLKKFTIFGVSRLQALLHAYRPTIVVSTFPAAAAAMSILKTSGAICVRTVTVITDHTDHSYWLYANTDHYVVGSDRVRRALMQLDIDDAHISVTGIPIRASFCQSYNPVSLREKHGLSLHMPTVMLMGGGHGMIGSGLIEMLLSDTLVRPMQFIIICGRNENLRAELEHVLRDSKHTILLKGYVDHVHEYMALSDLIITKPGGLTTSEAIALELPMLLYRPLPGQEQDNAKFLVEAGVAVEAKCEADLPLLMVRLFTEPELLRMMREKSSRYPMGNAATKAWEAIIHAGHHSTAASTSALAEKSYAHAQ